MLISLNFIAIFQTIRLNSILQLFTSNNSDDTSDDRYTPLAIIRLSHRTLVILLEYFKIGYRVLEYKETTKNR